MTSTKTLTDRQQQVLDFIHAHMKSRGRAPTVREIGTAMGIRSPNGVVGHLNALRSKGFIRWEYALARSLQIIGKCPCCGR